MSGYDLTSVEALITYNNSVIRWAFLTDFATEAMRIMRGKNTSTGKIFSRLLILALSGLCLYLLLGRDTPSLEPWHTVRLAEEFSEETRDSIKTFDSDILIWKSGYSRNLIKGFIMRRKAARILNCAAIVPETQQTCVA